jgi:hypothetical protein
MAKGLLSRPDPAWKLDIAARTAKDWYGLATPAGWNSIVMELHSKIVALYPEYQVFQIKEKFGELRYYCSVDRNDDVKVLIATARAQSVHTCQVCGSPGAFSKKPGPVRVLCVKHDRLKHCTNGYAEWRPHWTRRTRRKIRRLFSR